jgi:hypothetical protein
MPVRLSKNGLWPAAPRPARRGRAVFDAVVGLVILVLSVVFIFGRAPWPVVVAACLASCVLIGVNLWRAFRRPQNEPSR